MLGITAGVDSKQITMKQIVYVLPKKTITHQRWWGDIFCYIVDMLFFQSITNTTNVILNSNNQIPDFMITFTVGRNL